MDPLALELLALLVLAVCGVVTAVASAFAMAELEAELEASSQASATLATPAPPAPPASDQQSCAWPWRRASHRTSTGDTGDAPPTIEAAARPKPKWWSIDDAATALKPSWPAWLKRHPASAVAPAPGAVKVPKQRSFTKRLSAKSSGKALAKAIKGAFASSPKPASAATVSAPPMPTPQDQPPLTADACAAKSFLVAWAASLLVAIAEWLVVGAVAAATLPPVVVKHCLSAAASHFASLASRMAETAVHALTWCHNTAVSVANAAVEVAVILLAVTCLAALALAGPAIAAAVLLGNAAARATGSAIRRLLVSCKHLVSGCFHAVLTGLVIAVAVSLGTQLAEAFAASIEACLCALAPRSKAVPAESSQPADASADFPITTSPEAGVAAPKALPPPASPAAGAPKSTSEAPAKREAPATPLLAVPKSSGSKANKTSSGFKGRLKRLLSLGKAQPGGAAAGCPVTILVDATGEAGALTNAQPALLLAPLPGPTEAAPGGKAGKKTLARRLRGASRKAGRKVQAGLGKLRGLSLASSVSACFAPVAS